MIHFFSTIKNESLYYEKRDITRSYRISRDAYGDLDCYICKDNPSIVIKPLYGSLTSNAPTSYALYFHGKEIGCTTYLKDCKMVAEYI